MDLNLIPRVELKLSSMRRTRARQYSELTYVSLLEMFFFAWFNKNVAQKCAIFDGFFWPFKRSILHSRSHVYWPAINKILVQDFFPLRCFNIGLAGSRLLWILYGSFSWLLSSAVQQRVKLSTSRDPLNCLRTEKVGAIYWISCAKKTQSKPEKKIAVQKSRWFDGASQTWKKLTRFISI